MKQSTMLAAGLTFAQPTWAEGASGILRPVFDNYFEAWHGSDPQKVLKCFSDDIVINLGGNGSTLNGRTAVGDKWVIPTMKQFPEIFIIYKTTLKRATERPSSGFSLALTLRPIKKRPFRDVPCTG